MTADDRSWPWGTLSDRVMKFYKYYQNIKMENIDYDIVVGEETLGTKLKKLQRFQDL